MRFALAILCVVALASCQPEQRENIYEPGGKYAQRLDARGRRHLVYDGEGNILGKLRFRDETIRVYSAEMELLGTLRVEPSLVVSRREGEDAGFEPAGINVYELPGRLRIEGVDKGWAIFDAKARRLGYFDWRGERLALRDDYSSSPRVYAQADGSTARTPSGDSLLEVVPSTRADVLLPLLLETEALDVLDKVALGYWLIERGTTASTIQGPEQSD